MIPPVEYPGNIGPWCYCGAYLRGSASKTPLLEGPRYSASNRRFTSISGSSGDGSKYEPSSLEANTPPAIT